jgi:hypothetical protein
MLLIFIIFFMIWENIMVDYPKTGLWFSTSGGANDRASGKAVDTNRSGG